MLETAEIRPDERILFLGIPEPTLVAEVAARLTSGLLVAMGDDAAVSEARRLHRDLDNVMFVPGSPHQIPWRDGFFTRVIDLVGAWPDTEKVAREIQRVSLPSNSAAG